MTRICVLVLLLAGLSAHAGAQDNGARFTAKALSSFCNSPHGAPYDDGICAGYITGIADAMMEEAGMGERLCLPRNLSTSDFSRLVTRYLASRPELTQAPAAPVVRDALLNAFGCAGQ